MGTPQKGMNVCIYKDAPGFPRKKRERTQNECVIKQGCEWGIKLSPHYPIRGSTSRCHK